MIPAFLSAGILAFFGCHSTAENRTPQSETSQNTNDNSPSDINHINKDNIIVESLEKTTDFVLLVADKKNIGQYQKAADIIEKKTNIKGTIDEVSMHFAGWYLIQLSSSSKSDVIALDAPSDARPAFVVDLEHQKVIDINDFTSAKPLFDRLATVALSLDDPDDAESFVDFTAEYASAIAFGHAGIVGHSGSDQIPFPEIKKNDNTITLEFNVMTSGDSMDSKHNVLTMTDSDISFKSALAQ